MMRGTSSIPPVIWQRARLARFLNNAMGTTAFHLWNIDHVPDVDIQCLITAQEMVNSFKK